ncbi:MAG: hypothetical protein V1738_01540 [Patescibacteria group bacterium]
MTLIKRMLFILRAAWLAGFASLVRSLVGVVNMEVHRLANSTKQLSGGHPYRSLAQSARSLNCLPEPLDLEPVELSSQIEILNGNPDRVDTAMFRLPKKFVAHGVTLRLTNEDCELLDRLRRDEAFGSDEEVIARALKLFALISPKLRRGYLLRLECPIDGDAKIKKSFIYE